MTNYHPEYVPTISTMTSPMQYIEDYLRQEFFATELYTAEMMANEKKNPQDCVILSATDAATGERIATIQLNIKTLKVVQIRAKYDRVPERHEDIFRSIENNISMFNNVAV